MNWDGWTMRLEYIRCGKPKCKACPHGPYWYGYMRGYTRMRKRYFGGRAPWEPARTTPTPPPPPPPSDYHRFDAINSRATATIALALEILGLPLDCRDRDTVRRRFLELCRTEHPDKGGDARKFAWIHTANSYLMARL